MVAAVLVGTALATAVGLLVWQPPYKAQAVVQVPSATVGSPQNVSFDLLYTDRLLNTYVELAESDQMHDELVAQLGVDARLQLTAEAPANTELLLVEVGASDPELAARGANALAQRLVEDMRDNLGQRVQGAREVLRVQRQGIEEQIAALNQGGEGDAETLNALFAERDSLVRGSAGLSPEGPISLGAVSVLQPAEVPTKRALPTSLLLGLAGMVGLAGAFALALVMDRLDRRVLDVAQAVRRRGYPVLGELIFDPRLPTALDDGAEHSHMQPQTVRAALQLAEWPARSILVTSAFTRPALPRAVAELGRALASIGPRVVILDAAAEPALHQVLGTADRPGLQEALHHGKPLAELALPACYPRLFLVPGGSANTSDPDALEHFWAVDQLDSLVEAFDLVVVSASPLLERVEGSLLSKSAEASVLVVEDRVLHDADLDEALQHVTSLPTAFLGVVVARPARSGARRGFAFRTQRDRRP